MKWYWKVRCCYNKKGDYIIAEVETGRDLTEIDCIQDFYLALTGYKMLLEGMSESSMMHNSISTVWKLATKEMED